MKKDKALEYLELLKGRMYDNCIVQRGFDKEEAKKNSTFLAQHCLNSATAAEKIAQNVKDMDSEKAFCMGALHDIGRMTLDRFHGLHGYEFMMKEGHGDIAQVSLTHTFLDNDVDKAEFHFPMNEFRENDIQKTKELISSVELTDYDLLIRFCDYLSVGYMDKPCTIEERLSDIQSRYKDKIYGEGWDSLTAKVYGLKKYWEGKLSEPLYSILLID